MSFSVTLNADSCCAGILQFAVVVVDVDVPVLDHTQTDHSDETLKHGRDKKYGELDPEQGDAGW